MRFPSLAILTNLLVNTKAKAVYSITFITPVS